MKRVTLDQQKQIVALLQEALTALSHVDYSETAVPGARHTPPAVIGKSQALVRIAIERFGVVPVTRLDVDEGGEPRVVEGTAVVVERARHLVPV